MTDHPPNGSTPTVAPGRTEPPRTDDRHEHRRLLVGDLVIRRVSYRSVARVVWPLFLTVCAGALTAGIIAWNVAALAGWRAAEHDLAGGAVFWTAIGAGVVLVPLAVALALGTAALYNAISERSGGLEVAVVSPRRSRQRGVDG